jgi:cysteine desulfurase
VSAPIYLDYAATTPVDPAVARAMSEVLSAEADYGNAGSITHAFGRRAEARIETARAQVAALIGAQPAEIIFTSGATESNNLALLGIARANADRGRHIVTTRIEHKAVLDPCKQLEREGFTVSYVSPDSAGVIAPQSVVDALRADTVLVSVMHVNNETGVVQDIRAMGEACRARGILFHTDAAQSAGKLPLDVGALPVDLLSFTAHKIYGPKGIGALYVRTAVRPALRPVTFGGGQERGLRPGTLPTHQIVGFGLACDLAKRAVASSEPARLASLQAQLWRGLQSLEGVHLNGASAPRLPEILNVSFEGVEGESLIAALPDVAVTTGSACSSASGEPSYVLRALGRSTQLAQSSLRFSLGRGTTETDIESAAAIVCSAAHRLRRVSPAAHVPFLPETGDAEPPAEIPVSRVYEFDTLSPLARRYFDWLPGAGTFGAGADEEGTTVIHGEAGSVAQDAWVRFHLRVAGGNVKAALFQAYGCPHTLAASAWITGQLPGRSRAALVPGTPSEWLAKLAVPVEKLGRLLIVEDALQAALPHWT